MGLPNKITLTRIFLIPFVAVIYFLDIPNGNFWAGLLFSLICCTDFIDGGLARRTGKVTTLGKMLDPLADKIAATTGMFLLVYGKLFSYSGFHETLFNMIGVCGCILMISRDLSIGVFRQVAINKGTVISADILGKIKTVIIDFSIPILMVSIYHFAIWVIGIVLFLAGTVLSIVSFINYIQKNKGVFAADDAKEDNNDKN